MITVYLVFISLIRVTGEPGTYHRHHRAQDRCILDASPVQQRPQTLAYNRPFRDTNKANRMYVDCGRKLKYPEDIHTTRRDANSTYRAQFQASFLEV